MVNGGVHGQNGSAGLAAAVVAALLGPALAAASGSAQPYLGVDFEHNSNIFYASPAANLFPPGQDQAPGDSLYTYLAGVKGTYLLDRQELSATIEGRKSSYDHFSQLDHYEYVASASLAWKLFKPFDGTVDFSQERKMVPFSDQVSTFLNIQTQRITGATARMVFLTDWRANAGFSVREVQYPQPLLPDYGLHEAESDLGIKYIGLGSLIYGISAQHLEGRFRGNPIDANYDQNTYQLNLDYVVSDLTALNASVGDTKRDQAGTQGNISAVSGAFGYRRKLTGKTTANLQFVRAVNSYITAGGSEVDSTVSGDVTWQATPKLGVELFYGYTHSSFGQQTIPGLESQARTDRFSNAMLNLDYEPLRWFSIKPYVHYRDRKSTLDIFTFSGTSVGVDLKATFR